MPEYLPGFEPGTLDPDLKRMAAVSDDEIQARFRKWQKAHSPQPQPRRQRRHSQPATTLSRLAARFAEKQGHYPDAMKDSPQQRRRDAKALASRLKAMQANFYPKGLKMYRLSLPELDSRNLYDPETLKAAKAAACAWMSERDVLRCEFKLERGRNGGTHAHIITTAHAAACGVPLDSLDDAAAYLSKPADARACMPKQADKQRYTTAELESQRHEAAETYLEAVQLMKLGAYGNRQKVPRMNGPLVITS